jgi:DNA-binding GntR family transcriptional regulator
VSGVATIGGNHRPLRDQVADELRRRIIECDYAPGHRLTEDRLADDFGCHATRSVRRSACWSGRAS